jgi:hypothetical protein
VKVAIDHTPPPFDRGALIEVRLPGHDERIAYPRGSVLSIKHSRVSGWWIDVVDEADGMCRVVPASACEVVPG